MALSEAEELELLQLQKSKAMATQPSAENSNQSINMPVAKFAAKQALNLLPQAHPIENLPTIGGATGLALAGPAGMAAGTGVGKIAQNMIGIAQGDPNAPTTAMGAALPAMGQAALAGIAQEPKVLNDIPGVPQVSAMASNLFSKFGKGLARATETATGVKAKDITQAAKQGLSTYFDPSMQKAQQVFGEALGPEGAKALKVPVEDVFDSALTNARATAKDIGSKVEAGQAVSSIDALKARQATDRIISSTPVTDKLTRRSLYDWRSKFDDIIANQNGALEDASSQYRKAVIRDKILNLTRLNKSGEPSAFLPMLAGHAMGNGIPNGVAMLAGTSPLVAGLAATAGGSALKGLNSIAKNPAARQALLQILQRIQQNPPSTGNP